jgi:hypothetical protein
VQVTGRPSRNRNDGANPEVPPALLIVIVVAAEVIAAAVAVAVCGHHPEVTLPVTVAPTANAKFGDHVQPVKVVAVLPVQVAVELLAPKLTVSVAGILKYAGIPGDELMTIVDVVLPLAVTVPVVFAPAGDGPGDQASGGWVASTGP